ncbi:MAG: hypothetical protein JWM68_537 [Verrucomicrobiales bacterium]|nr:hypothetical protein [Verrucomicrobiales bacterium]
MASRLTFLLLAIFWVTMNFFLWRSEFGGRNELPSAIPAEKIWQKVLTAPDTSSLNIYHHGKKIGYCTWSANVSQNRADAALNADDFEPEGMVRSPSNYSLELEGTVFIPALTNSARFNLSLVLSTNREWQDLLVHASARPNTWELRASALTQKVHLRTEDDSGQSDYNYKFSDLQNPQFLMKEFGGPMALMFMAGMGASPKTNQIATLSLGLDWKAHNDWMRFGHSKVRVYKLEAKLLDRFKVFVFVSRVGEILWVHLPDELVLSNDAFTHF